MKRLNEREEQIMQILWRVKNAFVKEILAEMPEPKPPITTVSSIVRKLETEGIIGHEAFGKTHRYFPILEKSAYRKSFFQRMLNNYFGGSPEQLLSFFVDEQDLPPDELNRLLEKIQQSESDDEKQ
ncbi:BlaI/MecI/CopY family transcriptional regulator [Flavilitoribacter nigricans]|uniref:Transcriptional regulator n=1 Tax=Flavilitoribacter nigricans (strain ATCC 23147 / DSM 23189 / NBRC 102662 / NCIMB 1420 / SS-2) TaxID=1122177 RepID=A0A2D0NJ08_FLAN2|nr:BlaI/MecI/CopY family transcriptional regulator [Flavilitoribacter nigricans]PHN08428.1 transcriptional regulator [Flavilitoribacter nigricans DSM 23189 = NBRC 102662]